ncbi:MAG: S-methyl-5-thioribose-1-phosphate isomerase [Candidatus Hodarchaeaceae archaeon]|nr:S-methyl-5-thioribose-1-phosphate isomerase [Candidatus Hodarchaeaceae archaeon]
MRTIELKGKDVVLIDQTRLPRELRLIKCKNAEEVARAIERMQVRGAPALAAAAAMALAVTALRSRARTKSQLLQELKRAANRVKRTRLTAVNLFVGLKRTLDAAQAAPSTERARSAVVREARRIAEEDIRVNKKIGENGARLLKSGDVVLTHCNAGALATIDYGTALGVIRAAWRKGKHISVIATETRPLLQGARLTAWELKREGIPVTVITDSMVGDCFRKRMIDSVLVGADRIAANGDTANKIGTYSIAVLAREHRVPFYVVAPTSTIDFSMRSGKEIPIEQRSAEEVAFIGRTRIVPKGVKVLNPAFDVTPARLITAIVTENGIVNPGELKSLSGR